MKDKCKKFAKRNYVKSGSNCYREEDVACCNETNRELEQTS